MAENGSDQAHSHSISDLCAEGRHIYETALRSGRITRAEAVPAPCLTGFGLLRPDPDDANWLRPVPPSTVLARRLQPLEQEIQHRRSLAVALTDAFAPFIEISAQDQPATDAITTLEGMPRINAAIQLAASECESEILTIQPGGGRREHVLAEAVKVGQELIDRGITMHTIYQHTARHSQGTLAYAEYMAQGNVQIRTLEEVVERLMIFDRTVAFVPARDDRGMALEIRHPGLVGYLAKVFDQFWRRATPLSAETPYAPPVDGITGIQHSIAKMLVEGHVDEAIARRLGMNVRTCRGHIAKLSATLGSGSRAQLGFLIAQSGILEQDR